MSDLIVENQEATLETAMGGFRRDLRKDLNERGELSLNELLDKVYKWENVYGEKLSEEEFEVLSMLSMVLGTTKMVLDKSVGVKRSEVGKTPFIESVTAQQEILTTVLGNLGKDGKPVRGVVKSFALVTEVFEDYFNPENPRLDTSGVEREAGLWQGIQGMMTTVFLFKDAGWEIRFPPADLDVNYDIDLIVKSPEGKIFGVDVTAKMPHIVDEKGSLSEPFYVHKMGLPRNFPTEAAQDLNGMIRINVPPLRHHASEEFYEDRISCYPSGSAINRFNRLLNT